VGRRFSHNRRSPGIISVLFQHCVPTLRCRFRALCQHYNTGQKQQKNTRTLSVNFIVRFWNSSFALTLRPVTWRYALSRPSNLQHSETIAVYEQEINLLQLLFCSFCPRCPNYIHITNELVQNSQQLVYCLITARRYVYHISAKIFSDRYSLFGMERTLSPTWNFQSSNLVCNLCHTTSSLSAVTSNGAIPIDLWWLRL